MLGVNTVNIALPAALTWMIFLSSDRKQLSFAGGVWGGIGGAFSSAAATTFVAVSLALSGNEFLPAAKLVFFTHIPVMAIEAVLTGLPFLLARKVKPETI